MIGQTITCDRCHEDIGPGRTLLTVETEARGLESLRRPETGRPAVDLCPACWTAFLDFLGHASNRENQDRHNYQPASIMLD